MRRDAQRLPDALRVSLASADPSKVEHLFPEFFAKAKAAAGPSETVEVNDFEDPEEFEAAIEGKEVTYEVDMDEEQAKELANLLGQGSLGQWTVSTPMGPQEGVNPGADEGWL